MLNMLSSSLTTVRFVEPSRRWTPDSPVRSDNEEVFDVP